MKKILLFLLVLPFFSKGQNSIFVEGSSGNLYVNHSAAAKENFYSIGRLYNISPKEIAPFNKLKMENGLSIGQNIKVPLEAVNFTQTNKVAADEVAVPVYHKVEAKETLFQLSTDYNKVPVPSLKAWNNLKDDAVTAGQNIIVGYLKVKKDLSLLAQQSIKITTATKEMLTVPLKEKIAAKQNEVAKVTEEVKSKIEQKIIVEKKIETAEMPVAKTMKTENVNTGSKEGVFKTMYVNDGKEETGTAGIFKSTSGWEDGKYYCLQNSALQGNIVKITNPANGKSVYAKVLDGMPDLKQNDNLTIRISNAAADALGAGTANFECKINY